MDFFKDRRKFVPAQAFTESLPGYYFTMGPKGLGYYKDGISHGESHVEDSFINLERRSCLLTKVYI